MKILLINPAKTFQASTEDYFSFPDYIVSSFHGKSGFEKHIRLVHPDILVLTEQETNSEFLIKSIEFIRSKKGFDQSHIIFLANNLSDEKLVALYEKGVDHVLLNSTSQLLIFKYIQKIESKINSQKQIDNYDIELNSNNYSVRIHTNTVYLVKREFELLQFLISPPNKIYSRNEIIQHIWSDMKLKNDRTIDVHITRLRQKLNIDNIITIKRKGFKFSLKESS